MRCVVCDCSVPKLVLEESRREKHWGLVRYTSSGSTLCESAMTGVDECRVVSRDNKPGKAEVARPCFGLKAGPLLSEPCIGDLTVVKARGRVVELATEDTPCSQSASAGSSSKSITSNHKALVERQNYKASTREGKLSTRFQELTLFLCRYVPHYDRYTALMGLRCCS